MRGRRVGGRSRSRIRSSISTCFPQHVLPPTGASVSETVEFVKPEVQVSLWLTVSQYVWLGVEHPLGLKVGFFCLRASTVLIVLKHRVTSKRVCPLLKKWKQFSSQCSPINKNTFFWGGRG
jgi:hypothetical protein